MLSQKGVRSSEFKDIVVCPEHVFAATIEVPHLESIIANTFCK